MAVNRYSRNVYVILPSLFQFKKNLNENNSKKGERETHSKNKLSGCRLGFAV